MGIRPKYHRTGGTDRDGAREVGLRTLDAARRLSVRYCTGATGGPISNVDSLVAIGRIGPKADGSITQGGFARRPVIPGLRGERTDPRRQDARMPVVTHSRRRSDGVLCAMLRLYVGLAGQSGCCQHGCGD